MIYDSIIFSADDFGKSAAANKNILNLVKTGKIKRVSVMVNGSFKKMEIAQLFISKVKLDLHLTVPQIKNSASRNTGLFYRSSQFVFLYLSGRLSTKIIAEEWEKQVTQFVKLFDKIPDGLNSHEHLHFFPPFFKITLSLCQKYKISYLRFGKVGVIPQNSVVGLILQALNQINRKTFLRSAPCISSCSHLASLDWISDWDQFLLHQNQDTIEVVVHPERIEEHDLIQYWNNGR